MESMLETIKEKLQLTLRMMIAIPKAVFGGIFKIFGMMFKMAEIILNPFNKYNR